MTSDDVTRSVTALQAKADREVAAAEARYQQAQTLYGKCGIAASLFGWWNFKVCLEELAHQITRAGDARKEGK